MILQATSEIIEHRAKQHNGSFWPDCDVHKFKKLNMPKTELFLVSTTVLWEWCSYSVMHAEMTFALTHILYEVLGGDQVLAAEVVQLLVAAALQRVLTRAGRKATVRCWLHGGGRGAVARVDVQQLPPALARARLQ